MFAWTLTALAVCHAGIYNFLGRNFKAAGVTNHKEVTLLATYLVELSLVDYGSLKVGAARWGSGKAVLQEASFVHVPPASMPTPRIPSAPGPCKHTSRCVLSPASLPGCPLQFPYSQIAVAATYVAQLSVGVAEPYSHALQRHSGYTLPAIMDCAQHLASLMRKAPNTSLVAVYKKVGGVVCVGRGGSWLRGGPSADRQSAFCRAPG